jgi:hypothetical protein
MLEEEDRRCRLADVLADPERADDLDAPAIAAVLTELAALQTLLAAKMAGVAECRTDHDGDQLLTVDEAATHLRVTPDWLRRRTGLPFAIKISNGAVRYSRKRLDAWLERRTGSRT